MNDPTPASRAEAVAKAVLYEGYILYPYRPSSVKNQQRWNFGVVYPPGSSEGAARMQTQCLAAVHSNRAALDIRAAFLQLTSRTVREVDEPVAELAEGGEPASHPVERLECAGQLFQSWREGVEQEIALHLCRLDEMVSEPARVNFDFPSVRTIEPVRDENGMIAVLIVREREALSGSLEAFAEPLGKDLWRITVRLENLTTNPNRPQTRDGALLRSLVSAHKILTVSGAEFISSIDPPDACAHLVESNAATSARSRSSQEKKVSAMSCSLRRSSSTITRRSRRRAPEIFATAPKSTKSSPCAFSTLTDAEKREMRQSDERGRRILERTEALEEEQWLKLHGVLRGLRPSSEVTL